MIVIVLVVLGMLCKYSVVQFLCKRMNIHGKQKASAKLLFSHICFSPFMSGKVNVLTGKKVKVLLVFSMNQLGLEGLINQRKEEATFHWPKRLYTESLRMLFNPTQIRTIVNRFLSTFDQYKNLWIG